MSTNNRDLRLAAVLGTPERDLEPRNTVEGLLEEMTPNQLENAFAGPAAEIGVGQLLRSARQRRKLSMRALGRLASRSTSRVAAVEQATTDITVATLVQMADALGYRVELALVSKGREAERLLAELGTHGDSSELNEPGPTWTRSVRLDIPKQHVSR